MTDRLSIALTALQWIADHERDEDGLHQRFESCPNKAFHTGRPVPDARCSECGSRWWDVGGGDPHDEGSYTLGGVAARALADIAAFDDDEVSS